MDTDVLIDLLKGRPEALTWLTTMPDRLAVSHLVSMEVIAGCRNAKEQREAEVLLGKFATVYMTVADQERALLHFREAHLKNAIGLVDVLIAETAVGLDATLYTLNEKHFRALPELSFAVPYRKQ